MRLTNTAEFQEFLARHYTDDKFTRYGLEERFHQRPILAAAMDPGTVDQAAFRLTQGANRNFMVAGTNMTSALSVLAASGGITLTTAGANNDQALLIPATAINSVDQSAWTKTDWLTQKSPRFHCLVSLSSVASVRFFAGLKLTSTPTLATDDDQAYLSFDTGSSVSATGWRLVSSATGTDADKAARALGQAGNAVYPDVAAATDYLLSVIVDATRVPHFYVNGEFVGAGQQLTTAIGLKPFVGIQALTGAAKAITVRLVRASRLY
jgi:hypothetical protein